MESQSKFIREFSKEESQEDRDKTAKEIRDKRNENRELKKSSIEHDGVLQEQLESIEKLKSTVTDLSENGVSRLMNYFKLRGLKAQLAAESGSHEQSKNKEIIPADMEEPKRMLDAFYANQEKKWENTPYSKEDIKKNFSEEHMASLSLKEYALLLRRFPQEMVSHVTRQGVRDHVNMWHNKGEGNFHDGFEKIVDDGRLKSVLSITLAEKEKDKAIERFLNLDKVSSVYGLGEEGKKQALHRLEEFTREDQQNHSEVYGEYVDRKAIHFAVEQVADGYYGSEIGNEIFLAFPSAQIASQYYFDGQLKEMGDSGGQRNDRWVWTNEEKGIDINSGLVFIPESTPVSAKNGSRYEIDQNNNPMENIESFNRMQIMTEWQGFEQFAKDVKVSLAEAEKANMFSTPTSLERAYNEKMQPFMKVLESSFGIRDPRLQKSILSFKFLAHLRTEGDREYYSGEIKSCLKNSGLLYKEASDTIPSKEYWEEFFIQNPDKKPSKIVYYTGSPTKALWDWQEKNGLKQKAQSNHLGFEENMIERNSSQATEGIDRFKEIAERVINTYYDEREQLSMQPELTKV